ncbi:hypothetical protein Bca52824_074482 [Brassica carinata]|uniref:Uncharacterized protein n=1 Tax=Brassica carinata TaxID=52824 RepID=A0A8X7PQM0_BRACI|nr:hypothetical protein Bca52824_074482 [Brassica carinata]
MASTRVSSRSARHSSPSFGPGSMLTLNPSRRSRSVGCAPVRDPANQLPYFTVYSPADSHTCQTPWSVFQDGSNGEPTGRRLSTQMPRHAVAPRLSSDAPLAPFHLYLAVLVRHRSRPYLAFDGIYRPTAAFPNNPTRRQRRGATGSGTTGFTLSGAPFQGTWARPPLRTLPDYNSTPRRPIKRALPVRAATKGILVSFFSSAY